MTVACLERSLLTLYKQYHVPKLRLKRLMEKLPAIGAGVALLALLSVLAKR